MTKIAYLTGESGAGKGHLADSLAAMLPIKVLSGDKILSITATRVPPVSPPSMEMDTGNWLERAKHPELRSTFRDVLRQAYPEFVNSKKPVLAEATLLCVREIFDAFREAVGYLRKDIVDEKVFWLDADPATLVSNIAKRDRIEPNIDMDEANRRLEFFNSKMAQHSEVRRGDYGTCLRETKEYLQ